MKKVSDPIETLIRKVELAIQELRDALSIEDQPHEEPEAEPDFHSRAWWERYDKQAEARDRAPKDEYGRPVDLFGNPIEPDPWEKW